MTFRLIRLAMISTFLACGAFSAANAQEFVSTHGDWSVFTINSGGGKTCYIASAPVKKAGNCTRRGDPYALITHRDANTDEVSVSSGYPYKDDSKVTVEVDGAKNEFFTKGELAWAYDAEQDKKMVNAMKKGSRMMVKGTSQIGTYSIDTYSLKGATAAYNKMKGLCR